MVNITAENASTGSGSNDNTLITRLDPVSYHYIILLVSLTILGGGGNLLVILSPVAEKRLRTTYHGLIVHLAVLDFLVCCVVIPSSIVSQLLGYVSNFVCEMAMHFSPFLFLCSLHLQCVISYSRYKLVTVFSLHQRDIFSWKKFVVTTSTLLIFNALIYGVMPTLTNYATRVRVQTAIASCFLVQPEQLLRKFIIFAVLVVLPAALTVIFYGKLFWYIRTNSMTLALQKQRQAKMSLILFRLFLAWILGYVLLTTITFIDDEAEWPGAVYKTAYFLLWVNSCVNPILYGFTAKELGSVFKKLIFCNKRTSTVAPTQTIEMTPVVAIVRDT